MEKQLNLFFDFLENDKKLSDNTLQSYKRDLKQYEGYIKENKKNAEKYFRKRKKTQGSTKTSKQIIYGKRGS